MSLLDIRDFAPFPEGDNSTDTVFAGLHFNTTILKEWGYEYYTNGTLSNGSWCVLTFEPYAPRGLLANGTFVNGTWCYEAINPIGARASIGLGIGVVYALALIGIMVSLAKHGRLHLPIEKRFYPIGRRWQWYWAIWVCATAFISLFTNIDVDRYYLLELPIILTTFFWYLMQMGAMAAVWEAVRHWGSWMERQYVDPDPFILRQDDRRSMVELYLPLWFYLWLWLNFFLVIPRNWEPLMLQRSPEQTRLFAAPAATDTRFKVGAFALVMCWLTIIASLRHSMKHYKPRNRGIFNRVYGFVRYTPPRFVLLLIFSAALIAYQVLASFFFDWSVLKAKGYLPAIYAGGYGPELAILFVQIIYGLTNPNEDLELIRQRRMRGQQLDSEMGIVRKPAWWKRVTSDDHLVGSMRDRIARNVRELGGGAATARGVDHNISTLAREAEANNNNPSSIELGSMRRPAGGIDASRASAGVTYSAYGGKSDQRRTERTMQAASSLLFPNSPGAGRPDRRAELMQDGPPPYSDRERGRSAENDPSARRPGTSERSNSTATSASITAPPHQVRSMLDV